MKRTKLIIALALLLAAQTAANSAWAVNWVQDPGDTAGFRWIDMDSIEVRDGLTQYKFGRSFSKGVPPPANSKRYKNAINCTTGEHFRWYHRWVDLRDWYQDDYEYDQSGALRTLICNR